MVTAHERGIGRFAWVMAWVGLVAGQMHALARFSVPAHAGDLEYPGTRIWAVPTMRALRPLLGWGTPEQVYVHYGKVWLPVFVASTLCGVAVYRRRRPEGFERWAWRAAIASLGVMLVGVFLDYWTQWTGQAEGGHGLEARLFWLGTWVTFPGLALMLLTVTTLGITLLVNGFRPVLPAVMFAAIIPFAFAITEVTSLGSVALPVMFGFGVLGQRLAQAPSDGGLRPAVRSAAGQSLS